MKKYVVDENLTILEIARKKKIDIEARLIFGCVNINNIK